MRRASRRLRAVWLPGRVSNRRRRELALVFALIFGGGGAFRVDAVEVPFVTPPAISNGADGAFSVFAADVDGDGDLDVLSASALDNAIVWYENANEDGDGSSWIESTISANANHAYSVFAADVDGDGDVDVLSASASDDKVAWYENANEDGDGSSWIAHTITQAADGAFSVFAADVDGDGDLDVLSASALDDAIAWYENANEEGDGSSWIESTIANADHAYSVFAADVDGDGDLDVLSASVQDDRVAWYENANEDGDGSSWTAHTISGNINGASSVFAADVDGDGDLDALAAARFDDEVVWFENQGGGTSWQEHTIPAIANGAWSVFAADVDGDGDVDVLSASASDDKVAWYENGSGDVTSWQAHTITMAADGARSVFAADVDGDGDLDTLSASVYDDEIAWHENRTIHRSALFVGPELIATATIETLVTAFTADVDGDGDSDVLAASFTEDKVAWYENDGSGGGWMGHTITMATTTIGPSIVRAADMDGDGDLDAVAASRVEDWIAWYENRGGQFALPTRALAQGVLADAQEDAVFEIDFEHRGRPEDSDVVLDALELRIENGGGAVLNDSQANALIDQLDVYLDDGSGSFELPSDTLVQTIESLELGSGVLSIDLGSGDPNARVAPGESKRYFVVVTLRSNASSQVPGSFELIHLTVSGVSAHDGSAPSVPLRIEHWPDTTTGPIDTDLTTASCKAPFELDLEGFLVTAPVVCEAGTTLTAGHGLTVGPTGDLTLRAGERVRFAVDFSVQPGGGLAAEVDPSLEP